MCLAIPGKVVEIRPDEHGVRMAKANFGGIVKQVCLEYTPEVDVGESTVREYVRKRKIELGLEHGEVFVPQTYHWGQEGQVDWYEAYAEIDGEQVKAYVFCLRSMASGAAFHCSYLHATQQAFLEAHELAFSYFGGVFRKLRYDNLTRQ